MSPAVPRAARYGLVAVALIGILYQLASTQHIFLGIYQHQDLHLTLILVLTFLAAFRNKPKLWLVWTGLIVLTIISAGYVFVLTDALLLRVGLPTTTDMVIGGILVALSLIALHEAFGKVLPIFVAVFIGYSFFGHYLSDPFHHPELPLDRIMSLMVIGFSGLFGKLLEISASYLFLFMVFASLLSVSGAGAFFNEVGKLAARKLAGGPAMTSVVASSLFGTITGAPSANIIVTGTFTIPMMKKAGFTPEQAAGVEAAASTGGLIMPPIMAAAAFVMATFIGIPYGKVMIMAFPAALLYYFGCGLYVQFQSRRMGIQAMAVEIDKRALITNAPSFLIPMGIVVALLLAGYSPQYAVFWAIISVVATILMRARTRASLSRLMEGAVDGAANGARVGITLAALGIATSTMTMTGLGMKLPSAVEIWSGGNLLLAVLSTMVVTIIMGCGLPILPAYIITSLIAAPALVRMGVPVLQAHFFVLYFAAFSMVTPPVAVSALVASRLANAGYVKTAIEAMKVSLVAYLVPFLFIWSPVILLQPTNSLTAVISIVGIVLAAVALSAGLVGFYLTNLRGPERALLGLNGAALFVIACTKGQLPFVAAVAVFVLLTLWQWRQRARRKTRLMG